MKQIKNKSFKSKIRKFFQNDKLESYFFYGSLIILVLFVIFFIVQKMFDLSLYVKMAFSFYALLYILELAHEYAKDNVNFKKFFKERIAGFLGCMGFIILSILIWLG